MVLCNEVMIADSETSSSIYASRNSLNSEAFPAALGGPSLSILSFQAATMCALTLAQSPSLYLAQFADTLM